MKIKTNVEMLSCTIDFKTLLLSVLCVSAYVCGLDRNIVQASAVQRECDVSHTGGLECSSSHVKKFKRKMR